MTWAHAWIAAAEKIRAAQAAQPPLPLAPKVDARSIVGVWESGDGVDMFPGSATYVRRGKDEFSRDFADLGGVAAAAMIRENKGHPGSREDYIINEWIRGHGEMNYIMQWKEHCDDRAARKE